MITRMKTGSKVYSELYSIIDRLGSKYKERIPKKIYNIIEQNRDENYYPSYDISIPFSKQGIQKRTASILCLLHYNYWCNSEDERKKIEKVLIHNELIQEQVRKKYDTNIFKKKQATDVKYSTEEENQMIIIDKDIWYKRLFNKIVTLFFKRR